MTPEEFGQQQQAKIEAALSALENAASKSQDFAVDKINSLLKDFKADSGGTLDNSAENFRQIINIKSEIEAAILNPDYEDAVLEFAQAYKAIADAQNAFYSQMEANYKPSDLNKEVSKISIQQTVDALTESGIDANVVSKIDQALRDAVSTGAKYVDVTKSLNELMTNTDASDGLLVRYVKTYSVDSINQYSRTYNAVITADLDFDWFMYVGSNIDTSREFCIHMTEKQYFHRSEIPTLLRGDIDGEQVELNKKTDLPLGMKAETNRSNFITLAGGWQCGHQILGVPASFVPAAIRMRFE